ESLKDSPFKRLGSGLLSMNGERHRQQRRLMMPAFHKQAVAGYADLMGEAALTMVRGWPVGGQVALMPALRHLVTHIVAQALFGVTDPALTDRNAKLMPEWVVMSQSPAYLFLPWLKRRLMSLSAELESALLEMVAHKRRSALGTDVLSILMAVHDEDGARLTDTELVGQLAILFLAGYETTLNTLAWSLVMLSRFPHIRQPLVAELRAQLNGNPPTTEQAFALPALDRVIKETMRVLPPVIFTVRQAVESFELEGHMFPKDSAVILSHYITHRMPELYPQPRRFLPERWCEIDPSHYAYIPFSAGPRLCIGATFASLELRVVLATILQHVQLTPVGAVDYLTTSSILYPKGDLLVDVHSADADRPAWEMRGTLGDLVD
ncbi:MAG: cytochrome P450, partial [Anaerolineae bacterium]|nr:cytochrome P450 [Anaerolineae bacterium]